MDVKDAIGKLLHEPRRQQAHVSRKADKIDLMLAQRCPDFAIMLFALFAFRRDHQSIQAATPRRFDSRRVRPVRDDYGNLRVELARGDIIGDGLKVRPAPGKKDAKVLHDDMRMINAAAEVVSASDYKTQFVILSEARRS